MYLVICEKPSVAQSIGKVLGAYKSEDGYLSGRECMVSWCLGHLAEYAMPEAYDEKYRKWNFADLPIIPEDWKLTVQKDKAKQFQVLKKLLTGSLVSVDYVVNACDAGREGELIFKRVYDLSGSRLPVKRLWISSMEDQAIKDGFANLKDGREYQNLADASVCRAQADWLIGMNATRAYTKTYDYRLSVGRVQTPTLAMLAQREAEIANFQKKQYFVVHALSEGLDAISKHLDSRREAEQIADMCYGKDAEVLSIDREKKTAVPPKLYDLTTLQREANRLFGFTAKQTMEYAQSLYENKLLTYPRTDSQYLTDDMADTAKGMIDILCNLLSFVPGRSFTPNVERLLNNKKVSDHHAIIPTAEIAKVNLDSLSEGERKLFLLVANRLLCATASKHQYITMKVTVSCCGNLFSARGKAVTDAGWKQYEDSLKKYLRVKEEKEDGGEADCSLPDLLEGQILYGVESKVTDHFTQPPKPYTEDSLLAAMERAGNADMETEVERKGLGTPATRASIIEKLISSKYAQREKKKIIATEAGSKMIALMPEYLKSAQMTADWENRLLAMERGQTTGDAFMADIYGLIDKMLAGCRAIPDAERQKFSDGSSDRKAIGKCPVCDSPVYEGRRNFYCSNRDCSFALWKENRYLSSMKKTIDKKMASDLLQNGRIHAKDFYSAKTGRTFEADLLLEVTEDGKTSFEMAFPKRISGKKRQ
ncbi:MAG: DNA topoisomerase 3 [Lachnospiraceae bacterium]|uniref:DNA topoisomerase n=1 Tax=Porcincola intestinalis TaxID=2606632 RepID=A0A6L5X2G4_9FIRM|nr:type IA DNA topoisomerase [Porcincola intestinalis]MCI6767112.1 DNA topoisomerase 3 [Lachnospiraceae bacterium]MSS13815.1 DNA topoisomerase III [Porcincola intestinalis]